MLRKKGTNEDLMTLFLILDCHKPANNHNLWPSLQQIQTTAYINQNDFY